MPSWIAALALLGVISLATSQDVPEGEGSVPSADGPAAARVQQAGRAESSEPAAFPDEQLEQLVAPIALYPDELLAHVLMASTYPLEVVAAARWLQKDPGRKGDALDAALQQQDWDPSIKSLCAFPEVLTRMNDDLDWMQDLGDAVLSQQAELMQAVQRMRAKAKEAGTIESSEQQDVTQRDDGVIVIESADPQVVYVPTYYPSGCYGSWHTPYWYYPPMYAPPPAGGLWFGFSVGVIWGSAWGGCGWGGNEIDIDIERQNDFIDRTERPEQRQHVKERAASRDGGGERGTWQHDGSHRKGVGYRDEATAQRFEGARAEARVSRDQARGYGERGSTRESPGGRAADRAGDRALERPQTQQRSGDRSTSRSTGEHSGTFSGSRDGGLDRAGSSRGSRSRGSAGARGGSRGGGGRGRR